MMMVLGLLLWGWLEPGVIHGIYCLHVLSVYSLGWVYCVRENQYEAEVARKLRPGSTTSQPSGFSDSLVCLFCFLGDIGIDSE